MKQELSLGPSFQTGYQYLYNSFELDDYKQFHKPSRSHLMEFPMRNVQGNDFQPLEMLDSLLSL